MVFLRSLAQATFRGSTGVRFQSFSFTLFHPIQHPIRCFITDSKCLNIQIANYMEEGLVQGAGILFASSPFRNVVTWNTMIRGFFQNAMIEQALCFFNQMPERDLFSYNTVIAGLMHSGNVRGAIRIFERMPHRDLVSWNSMIVGFIHNSLIDDALNLFDKMPVRNVVSWNAVLGGLLIFAPFDIAERYFNCMPWRDVASWTTMISGLAYQGRMEDARQMFDQMPERDVRAWKTLLTGYIKNDRVEVSEGLFVKMPGKDSNSWTAMIDGLARNGRLTHAWKYFVEMPQKTTQAWNSISLGLIRVGFVEAAHTFFEKMSLSDLVSWTNLIIGYFDSGEVLKACYLFMMTGDKDRTLWNATISGLGENDHGEEGLKCFSEMKREGCPPPDHATFTTVLNICSNLLSLKFGRQTQGLILKHGFECSVAVGNAVIMMYARCGFIDLATREFVFMRNRDIISWNSIISGYSYQGKGTDALHIFRRMRLTHIKPDEITFIGVLSACSHEGLIMHGRYYFYFMRLKCFIKPLREHYTCMVDLMGRHGLIEEALEFINQMTDDGIDPCASVWGALLGSCRIYGNIEVGRVAGEKVVQMNPQDAGAYMILCDIYLCDGKRGDAERVIGLMKERRVKKQPGCSWIDIGNCVYVFHAGDISYLEDHEIFQIIILLNVDMEIHFAFDDH